MHSGRNGSHGRIHAAIPRAGLIAVVLAGLLFAGCSEPPKPVWDKFTVTAKPLGETDVYGTVLPVEFTVKNGHDVPVFIDRIEGTAGRRWELMAFSRREKMVYVEKERGIQAMTTPKYPPSAKKGRVLLHYGLLMPGQELTFVVPYRIIAASDNLILTVSPTSNSDLEGEVYLPGGNAEFRLADGGGLTSYGSKSRSTLLAAAPDLNQAVVRMKPVSRDEPILAHDEVNLPTPIAPFDPKWSRNVRHRPEAWAFSAKLGGYIVRVRAGSYNLQRENEVIPLPPTPFEFFDAIDGPEGKTRLLRHSGDVTTVTPENARQVLQEVLRAGRQVSFADDRERSTFEERPW